MILTIFKIMEFML